MTNINNNITENVEKYFKLMIENSQDLITIMEISGKVVYLTPSVERIMGYKQEEVIGKSIFDFVNKDDARLAKEAISHSISSPGSVELSEMRFRHKNGSWMILASRGATFIQSSGMTIVINSRDVTQDRKTQEKQREQSSILNAIINSPAGDIIFALDRNYKYIAFNDNHVREMKKIYNVDIAIGMNMLDMIATPELREMAKKSSDRALAGESFIEIHEQAGMDIFYEFRWGPISLNGKIIGLINFVRNVTERKNLENSLDKERREQQIMLDSIPAWIFYKDTENRFIHVNKAFADIMGVPKKDLEGKSMNDLFPKEQAEKYFKDDQKVILSGKPISHIIEKMNSPQGVLWVQTDKIPLKDEKGNIVGIIGLSVDITQSWRLEEARNENLANLEKFKDLMIGRELKMVELKEKIAELEAKLQTLQQGEEQEKQEENK
jgi:PAS domain S-box-containing protein